MYSALLVSRYIIQHCNEIGTTISNLKLQKILYFVQAEFLVDTGKPCFFEKIEAWVYGPVVPIVYNEYKAYGNANIPWSNNNKNETVLIDDIKRINAIVDEAKKYSAFQLVEITHHQTPWISAFKPGKNNVISIESIRMFFSEEV